MCSIKGDEVDKRVSSREDDNRTTRLLCLLGIRLCPILCGARVDSVDW